MIIKKLIILPAILLYITGNVFSQEKFSLNENPLKLSNGGKLNSAENFLQTAVLMFPFNPILLIENKKFYVGITKEISVGFFPYGRAAFEYSLIFRETKVNHIRASYNFDIPIETSDFGAFMISAGGGYFTDFDKKGFFPQVSFNLLLPVTNNAAINPYIKFRHTFMTDKEKSDISDLSFGLGLYIYF